MTRVIIPTPRRDDLTHARAIAVIDAYQPLLALAELFDCVEDAFVWVKDRDGRYCWVNRAFPLTTSWTIASWSKDGGVEQIIGKTDYDLRRPSWPISFAWTTSTCSPGIES